MDLQFALDQEACIQCQSCIKDCPYSIIEMGHEYPEINQEAAEQCIRCQHCLAVCPTGALSILGFDPADSLLLDKELPTAEQMDLLIRGRRSTRRFKKTPLAKETIEQLLTTTGYAPTGVNNRQCVFHVVEDPEVMQQISRETIEKIRLKDLKGELPPELSFFSGIIRAWDNDNDVLFRKAPHMMIVSSPKNGPSPDADGIIALSYFELFANSQQIGTLWDGLAKWAFTTIVPDMQEKLGIPEDHKIDYVMLFGKPAVKYFRTVQRDDVKIKRISG